MTMWRMSLIVIALFSFGCGSPPAAVEDAAEGPTPTAREILTEIAKTGVLSGETHIEEEIEKIRATDPNRASNLGKEYDRLTTFEEVDEIKQQAQRMLELFK